MSHSAFRLHPAEKWNKREERRERRNNGKRYGITNRQERTEFRNNITLIIQMMEEEQC